MEIEYQKVLTSFKNQAVPGSDLKELFRDHLQKIHAVYESGIIYNESGNAWECLYEFLPDIHHEIEYTHKLYKIYRAKLKENARQDYYYLITFTLDPKKNEKKKTAKQIEEYIHVQAKRKQALHIEKCVCSQEFHKDGRPHWHVAMITTKPLRSDAFAYYKKLYGNCKIDPSKTYKSWDDLYGYVHKENDPITLI